MKKRIFLFGFLILVSFLIGIFFEKEKHFPYVVLNNHAVDMYRRFQPKDMEPKQVINDPQNLEKYLEKSYIIDTYSVPLKWSQHQPKQLSNWLNNSHLPDVGHPNEDYFLGDER